MSLAGSFLLLGGILWIYLAPGLAPTGSSGFFSAVFRVAGPLGVAVTTASLFGLFVFLTRVANHSGVLWGSLGAAVVALSLLGLAWIVASQPPFASSVVEGEFQPSRMFATAAVLASWVRPVGILIFAFALIRADILFGRALLLFLIGFLEAPLVSNVILYLAGPSLTVEWPALLFGVPGAQVGVIGALAWAAFGYSLILLDRG
ncbi:MAG: hypothetical protein ACRDSJ_08090 [Rubrobacteraceae bacterium]